MFGGGRTVMTRPFFKIVLLLVLAGPLFVHAWVTVKERRYDRLRELHECTPPRCRPDIDGDGNPGSTRIQTFSRGYQFAMFNDGGKQVFRLLYQDSRNTLRTHIGVNHEGGRDRILIFDGLTRATTMRMAFAWDGNAVVPVPASSLDESILNAMAARDDSGTHSSWTLYDLVIYPLLAVYYLSAGISGLAFRKRSRQRAVYLQDPRL